MPPNSTLKTYLQAVNTGDTNITRVLTILMHYPAQWQPHPPDDFQVDPTLSDFLKDEFKKPGRMTLAEIDHIENQWPMALKENLRTHVLQAIEAGRPMVFKWGPTPGQAAATDIVWPPSNAPLTVPVRVTFRSPAEGIAFSGEEGNDDDVVVST